MSKFLLMPLIFRDHKYMTTLIQLMYESNMDVYRLVLLLFLFLLYMLIYLLALLFISVYCIWFNLYLKGWKFIEGLWRYQNDVFTSVMTNENWVVTHTVTYMQAIIQCLVQESLNSFLFKHPKIASNVCLVLYVCIFCWNNLL